MDKFTKFQKKYPNLFKEYPRCGFYLCDGWDDIVERLCESLEDHIKQLPDDARGNVYCVQVKEKFGGLRFYMNIETPFISEAIAAVEEISFSICDVCGKTGKIRPSKWQRTLCERHSNG